MKKKPKSGLWTFFTIFCLILTIAAIVGNQFAQMYATTINVALNTSYSKVVGFDESAVYYASDFETPEARWEYEKKLCADV